MKIVGGKDYWDSAAAYGVDASVTLVRNANQEAHDFSTKEFFFPVIQYRLQKKDSRRKDYTHHMFSLGAILFAGKAYPFCYINHVDVAKQTSYKEIIYSIDELITKFPSIKERSYFGRTDEFEYRWFCNQPAFQEKNVIEFLCKHNATIALILPENYSHGGWNWHVTNDPTHSNSFVWINPSFLKDWEFYRVKDSFTMFMETDQWVTGVLPQSHETIVLSDNSKIIKAGFDIKSSFRKSKEI